MSVWIPTALLHARNSLGNFFIKDVPAARGVEHQLETARIAGLGKKLLCLSRIVRIGLQIRIIPEVQWSKIDGHLDPAAFEDIVNDRFPVNGIIEGLTNSLSLRGPSARQLI